MDWLWSVLPLARRDFCRSTRRHVIPGHPRPPTSEEFAPKEEQEVSGVTTAARKRSATPSCWRQASSSWAAPRHTGESRTADRPSSPFRGAEWRVRRGRAHSIRRGRGCRGRSTCAHRPGRAGTAARACNSPLCAGRLCEMSSKAVERQMNFSKNTGMVEGDVKTRAGRPEEAPPRMRADGCGQSAIMRCPCARSGRW